MDIFSATPDAVFETIYDQTNQMAGLAQQSLSNGIQRYMDGNYKGAAEDFKRAFGLDPFSSYAEDAVKYQVMSYQKLGETDKAINAYKKLLEVQPDLDTAQVALGNLYFGEGRTAEAIQSYEEAVRIYDDATNRFSLGQAYLKAGRYDDAATQFEKVTKADPTSPNGNFGLGQTYAAQKKYDEAVEQFERALEKDDEFYDALAEIGFTYADAGEVEKAEAIQSDLTYKDESLAGILGSYIHKKAQPKMLSAWYDSTFQFNAYPGTSVAGLSDYLAHANGSQTFNMIFQFSKDMDRESVETLTNWNIQRSTGNGPGLNYNNGLPVPETEVNLSSMPVNVYWDEDKFTATVQFTVNQNENIDGTIDPSHIVFSFKGVDADGNEMHTDYDQFMGFSGSF